uniref:Outer membrane protein assembly factor BamE n=1 Tax=candidate division CPR3 bacterium TaxID=2268181 RepID=A0A7C4M238_UNCC3
MKKIFFWILFFILFPVSITYSKGKNYDVTSKSIGNIKLGMTQKQVSDFLGKPTKSENYKCGSGIVELINNYKNGFLVVFVKKKDTWIAQTISVSSGKYHYKDIKIRDASKKSTKYGFEEEGCTGDFVKYSEKYSIYLLLNEKQNIQGFTVVDNSYFCDDC